MEEKRCCSNCKYISTSFDNEPCSNCNYYLEWESKNNMDGKKCSKCKYSAVSTTQEPCCYCKNKSKWEPKNNWQPKKCGFKPGDLVVLKNGNNTNRKTIYIYLRNNWALRVPTYVLLRSECDYCFSDYIDKFIADATASWAFNYEYASHEVITAHDDRANAYYLTKTLNEWFSELMLIEKESKKNQDKVFTTPNMIKDVIFRDPATIIFWEDGTKTVVKTQDGEEYDKEKGFAMAVCKKMFGNERDYYNVFKRWMRKGKEVKEEKC